MGGMTVPPGVVGPEELAKTKAEQHASDYLLSEAEEAELEASTVSVTITRDGQSVGFTWDPNGDEPMMKSILKELREKIAAAVAAVTPATPVQVDSVAVASGFKEPVTEQPVPEPPKGKSLLDIATNGGHTFADAAKPGRCDNCGMPFWKAAEGAPCPGNQD